MFQPKRNVIVNVLPKLKKNCPNSRTRKPNKESIHVAVLYLMNILTVSDPNTPYDAENIIPTSNNTIDPSCIHPTETALGMHQSRH